MVSSSATCTARQGTFQGWQSCFLENGIVRLVAVPDIGGRIMAYDLGPYPYLFVDPDLAGKLFTAEENQGDGSLAAWKNYGGDKTWPAPQGWDDDAQWHGPPDPVLDTGRYALTELSAEPDAARIRMTSPPDPRTGVQITRAFTIRAGSSRVQVTLTFTNVSQHPIRWSIWDVVQLNAARQHPDGGQGHEPSCIVTAPINPASAFPRGFNVMFGAEDNPQWRVNRETGLFEAQYGWAIGKVGIDSPGGWIAFSNPAAGFAFCEQFGYETGAEYPDAGATVEVWTVGAGQVGNLNYAESGIYLMETEVLSPLRDIAPGASTTFEIGWGACRASGPVIDVRAGGACFTHLSAQSAGDGWLRLDGGFGVFDMGELSLVWRNGAGNAIERWPLGPVDPLTAVAVSRVVRPPQGAMTAELRIMTASGADLELCEPKGI